MNVALVPVATLAKSVSITHKKQNGRLVFLNTSDIERGNFLHREYSEVSSWPGQAKKSIAPNDILFSEIRPANGRWAFVDFDAEDYVVSTKLMVIRVDSSKVLPIYFYNWITSPPVVDRLQSLAESRSGTFPQITFDDIAFLGVPLPSLSAQSAIVSTLSTLDDKIKLNRRMNETLEALARAIFKDWFVDFGPTRRKLEGATDPVYILGSVTPDPKNAAPIAALFPNSFGDDGLPEGWAGATLNAVATVNDESWKASSHPAQVNYVDLSNTKWGVIETTSLLAWKDAPSRARRIAKSGDSIVGTVRPGNGSYAFISDEGYTASTGFAVLRPKRPEYSSLVYIASTRPENIDRLANLADGHGGAYPAVNPGEVISTEFAFAGDEILLAFDKLVSPIRSKIEHNKKENRTLAKTRDYLLPKLMSGEVHVRNADKLTEAVEA